MNSDASIAIILLLKGLFYKSDHEKAWSELIENSFGAIHDHFEVMGLDVIIDESEGYAYLQNKIYEEDEIALPKLIQSRELSYKVSLICVLLRKKMADFDMQNESTKAVVSQEDIKEEVKIFLPQKFNEVKFFKEIESSIRKVEELGFLKKLKNEAQSYEIRRSIKAFVDASWLDDFNKRLQEYKEAALWN